MSTPDDADAWSLPGVVEYFETHRKNTRDVYPSEWFFLQHILRDGISVLDVGCALGGFADIVAQNVKGAKYTGLDISASMISRAKQLRPQHEFILIDGFDFAEIGSREFDLVLCLGILHLNERWREVVSQCWKHTKKVLVLDLRETYGESIEDKNLSYFKMSYAREDEAHSAASVPYNVINCATGLEFLNSTCQPRKKFSQYGYMHSLRGSAVSPVKEVMMSTFCIEKE